MVIFGKIVLGFSLMVLLTCSSTHNTPKTCRDVVLSAKTFLKESFDINERNLPCLNSPKEAYLDSLINIGRDCFVGLSPDSLLQDLEYKVNQVDSKLFYGYKINSKKCYEGSLETDFMSIKIQVNKETNLIEEISLTDLSSELNPDNSKYKRQE